MKIIEFNELGTNTWLMIVENEEDENKLSLTLFEGTNSFTILFNNYFCSVKDINSGLVTDIGNIFDEIDEWTNELEGYGWDVDRLTDDDYYKAYFMAAYQRWYESV